MGETSVLETFPEARTTRSLVKGVKGRLTFAIFKKDKITIKKDVFLIRENGTRKGRL